MIDNPAWYALVISVSGWGISHWLTVRAQRKHFLNGVLNDARKDLVKAIRTEQDRIGLLSNAFWKVGVPAMRPSDWKTETASLTGLWRQTTADLTLVLEEYENLFPQLAICRGELVKIRMDLYGRAGTAISDLGIDSRRADALNRISTLEADQRQYMLLLEELRVYIQNDTLGRISGHSVPDRKSRERRSRLAWDTKGMLRIEPPGDGTR